MPDVPIISIIDDDDLMRCAIKSLVTSLGLRVHTFRSAEEFLQSPRVDDTSCLITDLQMPGLSGIELQSLLVAQARHMPIIGDGFSGGAHATARCRPGRSAS